MYFVACALYHRYSSALFGFSDAKLSLKFAQYSAQRASPLAQRIAQRTHGLCSLATAQITDAGVASLSALRELETLDLTGCDRIIGTGFEALAGSKLGILRYVRLSRVGLERVRLYGSAFKR